MKTNLMMRLGLVASLAAAAWACSPEEASVWEKKQFAPPEVSTEQVVKVWVGFECLEEDGSLGVRISNEFRDPALNVCKDRQLHEMTVDQWENR